MQAMPQQTPQRRTERLRLSEVRDSFRVQIAPAVLRNSWREYLNRLQSGGVIDEHQARDWRDRSPA